jgi:hypothetical protein
VEAVENVVEIVVQHRVFCCSIDRMSDQGDDRKSKRDDDQMEVCESRCCDH